MNNATLSAHPIEHLLVAFIFLLEGVCWLINEVCGFHDHKPKPAPHVQPVHLAPVTADWVGQQTVRQLRDVAKIRRIAIKPRVLKRELQQILFGAYTAHEALI